MEPIVQITAQLVRNMRLAYAQKWTFAGVFALVFVASVWLLAVADLLPNDPFIVSGTALTAVSNDLNRSSASAFVATTTLPPAQPAEDPVKVSIPAISLNATIANPTTTDIKTLDDLLLKGAVRYPTSAKLGAQGNVVLFGHSSYLPIVNNAAFKAFNDIQKLKQGDTVTVYSAGTAYTYAVRTVAKESAKDASISLAVAGRVLTLATCNSFGEKSDRFVVTADFVESHSIGA